jgi:hypothetical protein
MQVTRAWGAELRVAHGDIGVGPDVHPRRHVQHHRAPGVTGAIAYPESGDPDKCVLIAGITADGFEAGDEFCP